MIVIFTGSIMRTSELLFIDTSAWIALYDQGDAHHGDAVRFFTPDNLRAKKLIPVTTNFIFDEVYTYFCRNHDVAVMIGQSLKASKVLKLVQVREADEAKAWEIAQKYGDKDFSYTDCTSFAVMQRLNCHKAFAFDNHFRQMGFEVVP